MTMINPISLINKDTIMETIPVTIEDKETYLDKYNVVINDTTINNNNKRLTPKIRPQDVATALPPLKRAKSREVYPMTANKPMSSWHPSILKNNEKITAPS